MNSRPATAKQPRPVLGIVSGAFAVVVLLLAIEGSAAFAKTKIRPLIGYGGHVAPGSPDNPSVALIDSNGPTKGKSGIP